MQTEKAQVFKKSGNEEHMTWVGIGQVRKKGNIHKKKLEEPQTSRVGHVWVGGWMWYTNEDVGGGGHMRDVCMHNVVVEV